jgi:hypothetical protein
MIDVLYIKFYVGDGIRFYITFIIIHFLLSSKNLKIKRKGDEDFYPPKKKLSVKIVAIAIAAMIPANAPS